MTYRVDDIPWPYRPIWLAWSWLVALAGGSLLLLLNLTCRIRVDGVERLADGGNYIYSFWHRYLGIWLVAFLRAQRGHAWLQHPAAYMKPVHIVLRLMGTRICLGSSGEEGRRAAAALTELIKAGASTAITPDGPRGPQGILKKGVLHVAAGSGVPIVPVRLHATPAVRLPTWDRKVVPLPFSQIVVTLGAPIHVTTVNLHDAERSLADAMTRSQGDCRSEC